MGSSSLIQNETVLNEKYHILMPLGQGGFSITYLAETLSDGNMVVVKEFFNNRYMERTEQGNEVHVKNHASLTRFHKEKKVFDSEWDILNKFTALPGIVSPIDYFEANNTVYIVIQHLSGGSLKNNINSKGVYDADTLFTKIEQVLEALSEIHNKGFVHGDISPDNLVMDQDGCYKLIDFGAARQTGDITVTNEILRKEGYTAAEVFNRRARADTCSDIYSLCACFYYAMTGKTPMDSLERTLDDNLQTVKDLVPETDPAIDHLVMKGMAMDPRERWKGIEDINTVIAKCKKSEEERKKDAENKRKLQRRRKIAFSIGIPVCLFLITLIFVLTNWNLIKFLGAETQSLVIYYDQEMDNQDIAELKDRIRKKAADITGSKGYILRQKPGLFEITVKYEQLKDFDIPALLNEFFLSDRCDFLRLDNTILKRTWKNINGSDRIRSITEEKNSVRITISEQFLQELQAQNIGDNTSFCLRLHPSKDSMLMWDRNNTPYDSEYYDLEAEVHLDEKSIIIQDSTLEKYIFRKLLIDCLSNNTTTEASSFNYSRHITWENCQQQAWGKLQVDHSELHGKTVLLVYKNPYSEPADNNILENLVYEQELDNSKGYHLKERLDSLKIPYACGWDKDKNNEIYIFMETDSIWELEAALLTVNADSDFISIKNTSGVVAGKIDLDTPLVAEEGKIKVKIRSRDINNDLEPEDRSLVFEDGVLQLCIGGRPCFQTVLHEMPEDGWVVFDQILLDKIDSNHIENDISHFTDFVNIIIHQKEFLLNEEFQGALHFSQGEVSNWEENLWNLKGCEKKDLRDQIMKLADEYEMSATSSRDQPSIVNLFCVYDQEKKKKYEHPFELVSKFLKKIEMTNEVQELEFQIVDRSNNSFIEEYGMSAVKNEWTGTWQIEWWYHIMTSGSKDSSDEEYLDNLGNEAYDAAIRYLAEDDFYKSSFLSPPLNKSFKETVLEEDDFSLQFSYGETQPGEDYYFTFTLNNRTDELMTISHPPFSINHVMTGCFSNYNDWGETEISPHSEYKCSYSFSSDELHYSPLHTLDSAIAEFKICYSDKEICKKLEIGDSEKKSEKGNVPVNLSEDKKIGSSDLFNIYNLDYKDYEQYLLIENITDQTLVMNFKNIGVDTEWNQSFDPFTVRIMPGSVAYTKIYNDIPGQGVTEDTITMSIEIESYTEDGMRKTDAMTEDILLVVNTLDK